MELIDDGVVVSSETTAASQTLVTLSRLSFRRVPGGVQLVLGRQLGPWESVS
jgi:hypothetical protein